MEKYESNFDYDPQKYCRFCDGNLRGIRHIVDCRRKREGYSPVRVRHEKREKESENNTKIANNKLLRRPLELGVSKDENERDKTAKKTKEDNFEKVDRVDDKVNDKESEIEEKNHETLAEKVSKVENEENRAETDQKRVEYEEDKINAIVKEIEKAEKIYTHDMELIRVLERQVLSPQDRLALNKILEQSETLLEKISQAKDIIKRREARVKSGTAENDSKVEQSDKVKEEMVKNETKEDNFEKVDREEDKETEAEFTPEESKTDFSQHAHCQFQIQGHVLFFMSF